MKNKLHELLQTQSMYDLALDIGISQYSLYCYINNYKPVGQKVLKKIQEFLK